MRHTEDRIDQLRIGRTQVQLQQRRLHRVERLETLFEKRVVKLREIERHALPIAGAASRSSRPKLNSARKPKTSAVARKASEAPRHSTPRPAARRSRMKLVSTCSAAVSMRR